MEPFADVFIRAIYGYHAVRYVYCQVEETNQTYKSCLRIHRITKRVLRVCVHALLVHLLELSLRCLR